MDFFIEINLIDFNLNKVYIW